MSLNSLKAFAIIGLMMCAVSAPSFAQNNVFKVLGVKGDVSVDGAPLKVGMSIGANQSVSVGESAYLGMAHSTGKTLEIKKAGKFKVSELEGQLSSGSSSLAGKYASFVLEELTASNDDAKSVQRVKTGSVTRATPGAYSAQFAMPRNSNVADGTHITIKWFAEDHPADQPVKVVFRNAFRDVIMEQTVTGNSITLDLSSPELADQKALLYAVMNAEGKQITEEFVLRKLKGKEAEDVQGTLAELPNDDSSISQIIRAQFFEEKDLIGNAIYAYEKAIGLADVEEYRNLYERFLLRQGLSKQSKTESEARN